MGNSNSGKTSISKRIKYLFKGRFDVSQHTEEGVAVKQYKRQLVLLNDLLDQQGNMIADMTQRLSVQDQGSTQEKMLGMVEKLFLPQVQKSPPPQMEQKTLTSESGAEVPQTNIEMSDAQLTEMMNEYEPSKIKGALMMGDGVLQNHLKKKYPQISENSILRGIEIARGLF